MLGINRMYTDKEYRKRVVENIKDPSVKSFWTDEFTKYTDRYTQDSTPAIQNKVGQFTANPLIRNIIGQPKSSFDFRKLMDERKIIIVNLSKGRIGESNANLLGSMLITKIYLAAMSRADIHDREMQKLPNFYLYVDEFQSFANESFADILSEARKYKLNLTLAHQYIEQMSEEVRAAVFGNVGTMMIFRVGAYDAEILEKEFAPTFSIEDLVNLGAFQVYLKLMIDGVTSPPFSATTMEPISKLEISFHDDIVEASRRAFARPRSIIEESIRKWHSTQTSDRGEHPPHKTKSREKRESFHKEDEMKEAFSASLKGDDLVSLKDLSRKHHKTKSKKHSPEKLSELKEALSAILPKLPKDNDSEGRTSSNDAQEPKGEAKEMDKKTPNEVPKEDLMNILSVDDG